MKAAKRLMTLAVALLMVLSVGSALADRASISNFLDQTLAQLNAFDLSKQALTIRNDSGSMLTEMNLQQSDGTLAFWGSTTNNRYGYTSAGYIQINKDWVAYADGRDTYKVSMNDIKDLLAGQELLGSSGNAQVDQLTGLFGDENAMNALTAMLTDLVNTMTEKSEAVYETGTGYRAVITLRGSDLLAWIDAAVQKREWIEPLVPYLNSVAAMALPYNVRVENADAVSDIWNRMLRRSVSDTLSGHEVSLTVDMDRQGKIESILGAADGMEQFRCFYEGDVFKITENGYDYLAVDGISDNEIVIRYIGGGNNEVVARAVQRKTADGWELEVRRYNYRGLSSVVTIGLVSPKTLPAVENPTVLTKNDLLKMLGKEPASEAVPVEVPVDQVVPVESVVEQAVPAESVYEDDNSWLNNN